MKTNYVVYCWKDNGEVFYVGIGTHKRAYTKSSRNRHCLNKRNKAEKNNCFSIEILFNNLTREQACEIECQLISEYGRIDLGTGILTNMTDGGDIRSWSKEQRYNLSKQRQGKKNPFYGQNHTIETKNKISTRLSEMPRTEQHCRLIGEANKRTKVKPIMTPFGEYSSIKIALDDPDFPYTSYSTISRKIREEQDWYFIRE